MIRPLLYKPYEARSRVVPTALAMRPVLASCASFQDLVDGQTGQQAEDHIHVGRVQDVWSESGRASQDDLANILCTAIFRGPADGSGVEAKRNEARQGCPEAEFKLWLRIRRHIRKADIEADGQGREGVGNFLWDRYESLSEELLEQSVLAGGFLDGIQSVHLLGSGDAARKKEAAQGEFSTADYMITFDTEGGD